MKTIVETRRLRLRELDVDDAGFVLALVNEPSFVEHIGDKGVHDLEDAKRLIAEGPWTNQQRPGLCQLVVEQKSDGAPVGICGLLYRERLDVIDVGFAFLARYRGQGYATESAAAVLEYGRTTLGIERIVALTSKANAASIKVLEKLGMSFERMVTMSDDDPGTALYA